MCAIRSGIRQKHETGAVGDGAFLKMPRPQLRRPLHISKEFNIMVDDFGFCM